MSYLLTISLIGNAVLGGAIFYLFPRRKGGPLPRRKPDFQSVERELKDLLDGAEFHEYFELLGFEVGEWLCRAFLGFRKQAAEPADWPLAQDLVHRVREKTGLPGRTAGHLMDPETGRTLIAVILEFGYSREVGYDHPNAV